MANIRTRFAPSPTGYLHIGSLRTALYSYAQAKNQGGQFILRIEDTDRLRHVAGATEKLIDMLKFFGIIWDEGPDVGGPFAPYIQSERTPTGIYRQHAEKLLAQGNAYYCFCAIKSKDEIASDHAAKAIELRDPCRTLSPEEVQAKLATQKPAIRLKVPLGETVTYHDYVIGKDITWKTDDIDDVMLLKSDGFPTYHLGVVVDDTAMKITHITRAHEWLASTPVHLLLYRYFDYPVPQIGHVSDILDPQGGKLSKRKGSVACEDFLSQGYLPEAILNTIMLLGWAPKDNRELFSLEDFVTHFNSGSLQRSNPVFNREKLDWFNGQYIRLKPDTEIAHLVKPFMKEEISSTKLTQIIPLVKDRLVRLSDFSALAGFFFTPPANSPELWADAGAAPAHLDFARKHLSAVTWTSEGIASGFTDAIKSQGWKVGDFFMSLRIAICGSRFTPPLTESLIILGQNETLSRLKSAISFLTSQPTNPVTN